MPNLPPLPPSDHPALGGGGRKKTKDAPLAADIDSAAARLRTEIPPAPEDAAEDSGTAPADGVVGRVLRLFGRK